MTSRKVKLISAIAALSIATTGAVATATLAHAASFAQTAQQQDDKGIVVVSVLADSPAAKAGLKRGNILLKVDGKDVNNARDVRDALNGKKKGDKVELIFTASDQQKTATAELDEKNGVVYLGIESGRFGGAAPLPNFDSSQMPQMPAPEIRVTEVVSDSPAARAGLLKDDVILAINGTDLKPTDRLADLIGKLKPNDMITLKIKRADKDQEIKVTLGDNPDKKGTAYLGIRFAPSFGFMRGIPGEHGRGNRLPFPMQAGVFVGQVAKDSPAEQAGLKAGDVISAVNGGAIKTPTDLVDLVSKSKVGDKLSLSIKHDGSDTAMTIDVTLGDNPDKTGTAWLGVSLGGRMRVNPQQQNGQQGFLPDSPSSTPQRQSPSVNGGNL